MVNLEEISGKLVYVSPEMRIKKINFSDVIVTSVQGDPQVTYPEDANNEYGQELP